MLDDLSAEQVRALFTYDQQEGLLRWRYPAGMGGRFPAGSEAGFIHPEGYRYVRVNGRHYRASRLIWLYVTGSWPQHQIDHINLNPGDDRWENLRDATQSQNKRNNRLRKDSSIGYKCVVYDRARDKYRWQVVVDGKRRKSGKRFDTAAEAFADYQARLPEFHGEFANDGGPH